MKNFWHNFQQQYFRYSRSDRNAIIIIATLLLFVLIARGLLKYFVREPVSDFSKIRAVLNEWGKKQAFNNESKKLLLFRFDPNTISEGTLDTLALPSFVKQNIVRYRNAGGVFTSASDMRKIYGMNDSIYKIISAYIQIAQKGKEEAFSEKKEKGKNGNTSKIKVFPDYKKDTSSKKLVKNKKVELNTADSLDLVALPGIGPVFSRRIIRYRNLLGGFYSKKQLLEVYHLSPETYQLFSPYVYVDTLKIKRIRINFVGFAELLRHPYLERKQVIEIIRFREKNGAFKNLSQLKSIQWFGAGEIAKIRPYLTCR